MQRYPITRVGMDALLAELRYMSKDRRHAIIEAIASARAHGDLSENAEYHAAKEQQRLNEVRIAELEDIMNRAQVVDVSALSGDRVVFGAMVGLVDEENDATRTYQIVGEFEADVSAGRLAVTSPVARAILGKSVGDVVEVRTPAGERTYEIIELRFE